MGVIFSQAIASALYYFRPVKRAISESKENEDSTNSTDQNGASSTWDEDTIFSPETLLPLVDAESLADLREAVVQTVTKCLANVTHVKVYLKDPLSNQLLDEQCSALPSSGFIGDVLNQKGKTAVTVNSSHESLRDILANERSNDTSSSVFLMPIPERGTHQSVGMLVVESNKSKTLSNGDAKKLELCVKQVSVTYEVIKSHMTLDNCSAPSNRLISLIQLCSDLNDQDAVTLDKKVVRYLQNHTRADCGFLLLVVPETQELFCQVIGSTPLQEEIRFAGPSSAFSRALETKQPMTWAEIPEDRRGEIEKVVGSPINNLLCVPVTVADGKELLALACLANKQNQEEFNECDVDIIRQCFKYTATVLTSTLAFQNERKLKNQTQALLQVAKKLFTRLGKFLFHSPPSASPPSPLANTPYFLSATHDILKSDLQCDAFPETAIQCQQEQPYLRNEDERNELKRGQLDSVFHRNQPHDSLNRTEAVKAGSTGKTKRNISTDKTLIGDDTSEFMKLARKLKFIFDHLKELEEVFDELPFIDLGQSALYTGISKQSMVNRRSQPVPQESHVGQVPLGCHQNLSETGEDFKRFEPGMDSMNGAENSSAISLAEASMGRASLTLDICKHPVTASHEMSVKNKGDGINEKEFVSYDHHYEENIKVHRNIKGLNEFILNHNARKGNPKCIHDDYQDSDYHTMCSKHNDENLDSDVPLTEVSNIEDGYSVTAVDNAVGKIGLYDSGTEPLQDNLCKQEYEEKAALNLINKYGCEDVNSLSTVEEICIENDLQNKKILADVCHYVVYPECEDTCIQQENNNDEEPNKAIKTPNCVEKREEEDVKQFSTSENLIGSSISGVNPDKVVNETDWNFSDRAEIDDMSANRNIVRDELSQMNTCGNADQIIRNCSNYNGIEQGVTQDNTPNVALVVDVGINICRQVDRHERLEEKSDEWVNENAHITDNAICSHDIKSEKENIECDFSSKKTGLSSAITSGNNKMSQDVRLQPSDEPQCKSSEGNDYSDRFIRAKGLHNFCNNGRVMVQNDSYEGISERKNKKLENNDAEIKLTTMAEDIDKHKVTINRPVEYFKDKMDNVTVNDLETVCDTFSGTCLSDSNDFAVHVEDQLDTWNGDVIAAVVEVSDDCDFTSLIKENENIERKETIEEKYSQALHSTYESEAKRHVTDVDDYSLFSDNEDKDNHCEEEMKSFNSIDTPADNNFHLIGDNQNILNINDKSGSDLDSFEAQAGVSLIINKHKDNFDSTDNDKDNYFITALGKVGINTTDQNDDNIKKTDQNNADIIDEDKDKNNFYLPEKDKNNKDISDEAESSFYSIGMDENCMNMDNLNSTDNDEDNRFLTGRDEDNIDIVDKNKVSDQLIEADEFNDVTTYKDEFDTFHSFDADESNERVVDKIENSFVKIAITEDNVYVMDKDEDSTFNSVESDDEGVKVVESYEDDYVNMTNRCTDLVYINVKNQDNHINDTGHTEITESVEDFFADYHTNSSGEYKDVISSPKDCINACVSNGEKKGTLDSCGDHIDDRVNSEEDQDVIYSLQNYEDDHSNSEEHKHVIVRFGNYKDDHTNREEHKDVIGDVDNYKDNCIISGEHIDMIDGADNYKDDQINSDEEHKDVMDSFGDNNDDHISSGERKDGIDSFGYEEDDHTNDGEHINVIDSADNYKEVQINSGEPKDMIDSFIICKHDLTNSGEHDDVTDNFNNYKDDHTNKEEDKDGIDSVGNGKDFHTKREEHKDLMDSICDNVNDDSEDFINKHDDNLVSIGDSIDHHGNIKEHIDDPVSNAENKDDHVIFNKDYGGIDDVAECGNGQVILIKKGGIGIANESHCNLDEDKNSFHETDMASNELDHSHKDSTDGNLDVFCIDKEHLFQSDGNKDFPYALDEKSNYFADSSDVIDNGNGISNELEGNNDNKFESNLFNLYSIDQTDDALEGDDQTPDLLERIVWNADIHQSNDLNENVPERNYLIADILESEGLNAGNIDSNDLNAAILDNNELNAEVFDEIYQNKEILEGSNFSAEILDHNDQNSEIIDSDEFKEEIIGSKDLNAEVFAINAWNTEIAFSNDMNMEVSDKDKISEITDGTTQNDEIIDNQNNKILESDGKNEVILKTEDDKGIGGIDQMEELLETDDEREGILDNEGHNRDILNSEHQNQEILESDYRNAEIFYIDHQNKDNIDNFDPMEKILESVDERKEIFYSDDQNEEIFDSEYQTQETFFSCDQNKDIIYDVDQREEMRGRLDQSDDTFSSDNRKEKLLGSCHQNEEIFRNDGQNKEILGKNRQKEKIYESDERIEEIFENDDVNQEILDSDDQNEVIHGSDDQNEEILSSVDDNKEMISSNDQNEEILGSDDDNKEMISSDDQNEEILGSDDDNKEMTSSDDQNEEILSSVDDNKEMISSDDQKEEICGIDDDKEEVLGNDNENEEIISSEEQKGEILESDNDKEEILGSADDKEEILVSDNDKEEILRSDSENKEMISSDGQKEEMFGNDDDKEEILGSDNDKEEILERDNEDEELISSHDQKEEILGSNDDQNEEILHSDFENKIILGNEETLGFDEQNEQILWSGDQNEEIHENDDQNEETHENDDHNEEIHENDDQNKEILGSDDQNEEFLDSVDDNAEIPGSDDHNEIIFRSQDNNVKIIMSADDNEEALGNDDQNEKVLGNDEQNEEILQKDDQNDIVFDIYDEKEEISGNDDQNEEILGNHSQNEEFLGADDQNEIILESEDDNEEILRSDDDSEEVLGSDGQNEETLGNGDQDEEILQNDGQNKKILGSNEQNEIILASENDNKEITMGGDQNEEFHGSDDQKEEIFESEIQNEEILGNNYQDEEILENDDQKEGIFGTENPNGNILGINDQKKDIFENDENDDCEKEIFQNENEEASNNIDEEVEICFNDSQKEKIFQFSADLNEDENCGNNDLIEQLDKNDQNEDSIFVNDQNDKVFHCIDQKAKVNENSYQNDDNISRNDRNASIYYRSNQNLDTVNKTIDSTANVDQDVRNKHNLPQDGDNRISIGEGADNLAAICQYVDKDHYHSQDINIDQTSSSFDLFDNGIDTDDRWHHNAHDRDISNQSKGDLSNDDSYLSCIVQDSVDSYHNCQEGENLHELMQKEDIHHLENLGTYSKLAQRKCFTHNFMGHSAENYYGKDKRVDKLSMIECKPEDTSVNFQNDVVADLERKSQKDDKSPNTDNSNNNDQDLDNPYINTEEKSNDEEAVDNLDSVESHIESNDHEACNIAINHPNLHNHGQEANNVENYQDANNIYSHICHTDNFDNSGSNFNNLDSNQHPADNLDNLGDIDQDVDNLGNSDQDVDNLGNNDQDVDNLGNIDQDVDNLGNIDQDLDNLGNIDQDMDNLGNIDQDVDNLVTIDQDVDNLGNIDQDVDNLVIIDQDVDNLVTIDQDVDNLVTIDQDVDNLGNIDQDVDNLGNIDPDMDNLSNIDQDVDNLVTIDQDVDNLGNIDQDVDNLGTIDQDMDNLGNIDQDVDNLGTIDQDMDNLGNIDPDVDNLVTIDQDVDNLGNIDQDVDNLGNIDPDLDNLGYIDQDVDNLDNIDQNVDNLGNINQDVDNLGNIDPDLDNLGNIDQDVDNLCIIDQDVDYLVNIDQNVDNLGIIDKDVDNLGNTDQDVDNLSNIGKDEDNLGNIDQDVDNLDNIDQNVDNLGNIDQDVDNLGNIDQDVDNLGNIDQHLDNLGNIDQDVDNLGNIDQNVDNLGNIDQDVDNLGNIDQDMDNLGNIDQDVDNLVTMDQNVDRLGNIHHDVDNFEGNHRDVYTPGNIDQDVDNFGGIDRYVDNLDNIDQEVDSLCNVDQDVDNLDKIEQDVGKLGNVDQDVDRFGKNGGPSHVDEYMNDLGNINQDMDDLGNINQDIDGLGNISQDMDDLGNINHDMNDLDNINQDMDDLGNINQDMDNLGNINQDMDVLSNINQDMGDPGNINQDMDDLGNINQDMDDLVNINQGMDGLGNINHDMDDLGNINQDMDGFGNINQDMDDLGNINQDMDYLGNINQDTDGLGNTNHDMDGLGNINQDMNYLGNINQDTDDLGNTNHDMDGLGNINQDIDDLGNINQDMDGLGNINHDMDGLGNINQDMDGLGNINHDMGDLGNINHDMGDPGNIIQDMDDPGNINQDMDGLGNINHDMGDLGNINHDMGDPGNINQDMGDPGNINQYMDDLGNINQDMDDLVNINQGMDGLGNINHDMDDLGNINQDMDGLGNINQDIDDLGNINQDMDYLGNINQDTDDLGNTNLDMDGLGNINQDIDDLGNINQDMDGLGNINQDMDGLGNINHDMDGLGNINHDMDGLGNINHDMDGLGNINQDMDGFGNINQDMDYLGNINHDMDGLGSTNQDMDDLDNINHDMDDLGNITEDVDNLVNINEDGNNLGDVDNFDHMDQDIDNCDNIDQHFNNLGKIEIGNIDEGEENLRAINKDADNIHDIDESVCILDDQDGNNHGNIDSLGYNLGNIDQENDNLSDIGQGLDNFVILQDEDIDRVNQDVNDINNTVQGFCDPHTIMDVVDNVGNMDQDTDNMTNIHQDVDKFDDLKGDVENPVKMDKSVDCHAYNNQELSSLDINGENDISGNVAHDVDSLDNIDRNVDCLDDIDQNVDNFGNMIEDVNNPAIIDQVEGNLANIDKDEDNPPNIDKVQDNPAIIDQVQDNPTYIDQVQDNPAKIDQVEDNPAKINQREVNPAMINQVEDIPAMIDKVEDNPAIIDQVEDNPANNDKVEDNPAIIDQVEDIPAIIDQVEDIPAIIDQVEDNPAIIDQVEDIPAIIDQVEDNPDIIDQVEDNPAIIDKIEDSPASIDQVEDNPAISDQVEDNPAIIDRVEDNPAIIDRVEDNSANIDQVEDNSANIDKIEDNPAIINKIEDNPAIIDQFEDNPAIIDQVEGNTNIIDQVEGNTTIIDQVDSNTTIIDQVEGNTTIIDQVEGNTAIIDQVEGNTTIIDQVENNTTIIDQVEGNTTIIDQVEDNPAIIDQVEGNTTIIDQVEGNTAIIDQVEGNTTIIDQVEGNTAIIDQVEDNLGNIDQVEDNLAIIDQVEDNPAIIDQVEVNTTIIDQVEDIPAIIDQVEGNTAIIDQVEGNTAIIDQVEDNRVIIDQVEDSRVIIDQVEDNRVIIDQVEDNRVIIDQVEDNSANIDRVEDNSAIIDQVEDNPTIIDHVEDNPAKTDQSEDYPAYIAQHGDDSVNIKQAEDSSYGTDQRVDHHCNIEQHVEDHQYIEKMDEIDQEFDVCNIIQDVDNSGNIDQYAYAFDKSVQDADALGNIGQNSEDPDSACISNNTISDTYTGSYDNLDVTYDVLDNNELKDKIASSLPDKSVKKDIDHCVINPDKTCLLGSGRDKKVEKVEENEFCVQSLDLSTPSATLYGESDLLSGEDEALDADISNVDFSLDEIHRVKIRQLLKYSLLAISRSKNIQEKNDLLKASSFQPHVCDCMREDKFKSKQTNNDEVSHFESPLNRTKGDRNVRVYTIPHNQDAHNEVCEVCLDNTVTLNELHEKDCTHGVLLDSVYYTDSLGNDENAGEEEESESKEQFKKLSTLSDSFHTPSSVVPLSGARRKLKFFNSPHSSCSLEDDTNADEDTTQRLFACSNTVLSDSDRHLSDCKRNSQDNFYSLKSESSEENDGVGYQTSYFSEIVSRGKEENTPVKSHANQPSADFQSAGLPVTVASSSFSFSAPYVSSQEYYDPTKGSRQGDFSFIVNTDISPLAQFSSTPVQQDVQTVYGPLSSTSKKSVTFRKPIVEKYTLFTDPFNDADHDNQDFLNSGTISSIDEIGDNELCHESKFDQMALSEIGESTDIVSSSDLSITKDGYNDLPNSVDEFESCVRLEISHGEVCNSPYTNENETADVSEEHLHNCMETTGGANSGHVENFPENEGVAPIEINYDPFINIGSSQPQYGYFFDKLPIISEENENTTGETENESTEDESGSIEWAPLESKSEESLIVHHKIDILKTSVKEIENQENRETASNTHANRDLETDEKANEEVFANMRTDIDLVMNINEKEKLRALSKSRGGSKGYGQIFKDSEVNEQESHGCFQNTLQNRNDLEKITPSEKEATHLASTALCSCLDEFQLEVSLCIHLDDEGSTSLVTNSDKSTKSQRGTPMKDACQKSYTGEEKLSTLSIGHSESRTSATQLYDEEDNHVEHVNKTLSCDAHILNSAHANSWNSNDNEAFSDSPSNSQKGVSRDIIENPLTQFQNQEDKMSGTENDVFTLSEKLTTHQEEITYTSTDSPQTAFCAKYYTLSFIDEDDADQTLHEDKVGNNNQEEASADLPCYTYPPTNFNEESQLLPFGPLKNEESTRITLLSNQTAECFEDARIKRRVGNLKGCPETSVANVERNKNDLIHEWIAKTVSYAANPDIECELISQDISKEPVDANLENNIFPVFQEDFSVHHSMVDCDNLAKVTSCFSSRPKDGQIKNGSFRESTLNEAFIVNDGNESDKLSEPLNQCPTDPKCYVRNKSIGECKYFTTNAVSDDDLDAFSESYTDVMNTADTLSEQLITDSSSSKSDSDILNHTSSRIHTLAELKKLQEGCYGFDVPDDLFGNSGCGDKESQKKHRANYFSKVLSDLNNSNETLLWISQADELKDRLSKDEGTICTKNHCTRYFHISHDHNHCHPSCGTKCFHESSVFHEHSEIEKENKADKYLTAIIERRRVDNNADIKDVENDSACDIEKSEIGLSPPSKHSHHENAEKSCKWTFQDVCKADLNLLRENETAYLPLRNDMLDQIMDTGDDIRSDLEPSSHFPFNTKRSKDLKRYLNIQHDSKEHDLEERKYFPSSYNDMSRDMDQVLDDTFYHKSHTSTDFTDQTLMCSKDCSHNDLNDCLLTSLSVEERDDDSCDSSNSCHNTPFLQDKLGLALLTCNDSKSLRGQDTEKEFTNTHSFQLPQQGVLSSYNFRQRGQVLFSDIIGTLPCSLTPDSLDDLTKLLREIMQEARNLTDAERCSVFLLDKETDELVAMVFDGITADDKERLLNYLRTRQGANERGYHIDTEDEFQHWLQILGIVPGRQVQGEIRLPKTQGIAGHVATTGKLLNIRDAYSHPLFYRGIDDSTGFRTRNILCFPIKDEEGVVLGVAQLCNKKTFQYFTVFDEDIASAFAVYCCISISHSLMYKKVIDIQYRNSLANELMMFHMQSLMYKKLQDTQHRQRLANELMLFHINQVSRFDPRDSGVPTLRLLLRAIQQVPAEEVHSMAEQHIPPVTTFSSNFDSFDFPPRAIPEGHTVLSCLSMFEDLGFLSRWRIRIDTLVRFLLMVKKGYRNPPYHNWMHAYSVTHFCYLLIKNLHLQNYLEDIELLALFVSCLCHDIDHRGTTNSFQVQSQSVLAALYSSEGSVMERHHLAQSMCILNTEGSNLFEQLSSKEYQTVLDLMKEIILATDLAHHLRIYNDQKALAESGKYDRNNPTDRHTLITMLMTSCDLSDQTKNWNQTKLIASLVYQEFFSQGDLEKALGKNPLEMMDRERACIPELQISFLDNIAAPVYRVLARMFPEASVVASNVEDNRKHWVHVGELLKLRHGNSTQAMSLDQIISIEDQEEDDTVTGNNNNNTETSQQVNGR